MSRLKPRPTKLQSRNPQGEEPSGFRHRSEASEDAELGLVGMSGG
jgi:hypothetical protein